MAVINSCPTCAAPMKLDRQCSACGSARGLGAATYAKRTARLLLPGTRNANTLSQALRSAGATITGEDARTVAFTAERRSARSLGIRIRYLGQAELAPAAEGTLVTLRARPAPASLALLSVLLVGLILALTLFGNKGQLFPDQPAGLPADYAAGRVIGTLVFFGGLGVAIPYLLLSRGGARRLLAKLIPAIQATPRPAAVAEGMFVQLRELDALRAEGVLNTVEHEQARAALLAKIT